MFKFKYYFIIAILLLLTQCKKHDAGPMTLTGLSSSTVKYGSVLTISGQNINPAVLYTIVLSDSLKEYHLKEMSASKTGIQVEIYNQENPNQLLQLTQFRVGIRTSDPNSTTLWCKQTATLVSSWNRVADFPGSSRYKSSIFSLKGNLYVGGGAAGIAFNDFWKFDPAANSWTRLADFPGVRCYPRAFANDENGYLGAGYSSDNSSKVQLYDYYKYNTQSNTWTQIPSYPDNVGSFYVGYSVTVNGRPFVSLSNTTLTMRELVNDTWNSLTTIQDMTDCPASGVFAIGKKFYVVVGNRINNSVSNSTYEYNTENNAWTQKASFPGPARFAPAFFSLGNYGYYGCGMATDLTQYQDMWRYDPSADKWIRIDDFPAGVRSHLVSSSDGHYGFAGLGIVWNASYKNDFWQYDPE